MSKDPAFLFYPNDWLGGTMGMSFEEKGAYMEILMMQFSRGHMSEHMIGRTIGQIWDTIKVKFIQDEKGLWYNQRLELEQIRRKSFVSSRNNNKLGKNQFTKNGHMSNHMGNENENVNTSIKGVKFLNEKNSVQMSDGTIQELGEKQKEFVQAGDYKPHNILKDHVF